MRRLLVLVAALALAGCGGEDPRGDLLLRADRLFDGEHMIEPGAVLVRGDEIVAVGGELGAEATRTIDLGDATILPGFIDLHVHRNELLSLELGVTTVRNVGEPLDALSAHPDGGQLRVLSAGPLVTVPGGYPGPVHGFELSLEVKGAADARRAVRDLARRGAAIVKIALEPGPFGGDWPMLSVEQVRAIADEAHAHDLRVTAHVQRQAALDVALAGGVDELAHMPCEPVREESLRELVEREIAVVATLHVVGGTPTCVRAASRFVAAGGRLLYGSDLGNPGIPYGIDVEELRLLVRAGLEPEEALAAATQEAGKAIGLAPLGTLAKGAPADVIALRGDARELRDDLLPPLLVVRGGHVFREALG